MAAIVDSYTKRIIAGSPGRNNEGENGGTGDRTGGLLVIVHHSGTETVEDHLRSLLAESKKLPVQGGADTWLSRELRARSDNEKLSEALTDPECTLERARQICLSVDAPSTRALKSPGVGAVGGVVWLALEYTFGLLADELRSFDLKIDTRLGVEVFKKTKISHISLEFSYFVTTHVVKNMRILPYCFYSCFSPKRASRRALRSAHLSSGMRPSLAMGIYYLSWREQWRRPPH